MKHIINGVPRIAFFEQPIKIKPIVSEWDAQVCLIVGFDFNNGEFLVDYENGHAHFSWESLNKSFEGIIE